MDSGKIINSVQREQILKQKCHSNRSNRALKTEVFNKFFKDKAWIALGYGSNVTTDREGKEHLNVELRKIKKWS